MKTKYIDIQTDKGQKQLENTVDRIKYLQEKITKYQSELYEIADNTRISNYDLSNMEEEKMIKLADLASELQNVRNSY